MATSSRSRYKCKKCRVEKKKCVLPNPPETRCDRCRMMGQPCGRILLLGPRGNIETNTFPRPVQEPSSSAGTDQMSPRTAQDPVYTLISGLDVSDVAYDTLLHNFYALRFWMTVMLPAVYGFRQLERKLSVSDDTTFQLRSFYLSGIYQDLIVCHEHNLASWDVKIEADGSFQSSSVTTAYDLLTDQIDRMRQQHLQLNDHTSTPQSILQPPAHELLSETSVNSACLAGYVLHSQRLLADIDPEIFQTSRHEPRELGLDSQTHLKLQTQLHEALCLMLGQQYPSVPLPAAHLAYLSGDKDSAYDLTIAKGRLDLPLNFCNLNLLHLVVQARDRGFLIRLQEFDSKGLKEAATQSPGYTPVMIATILDYPEILETLVGDCVNVINFTQGLFGLAMKSNSFEVMKFLLRTGRLIRQPSTNDISECIDRGIENVALLILEKVKDPQYKQPKFCDLADSAESKSLHRLAERLRLKQPTSINPSRALASIEQHERCLPHALGSSVTSRQSMLEFSTDSFDNSSDDSY